MSRTLRKTGTITLTIVVKSDTDDNKPVPSPPHDEEGAQPTREFLGNQSEAELETQLEAWVNDWFEKQFPQPLGASQMEFDSVSVVIT